MSLILMASELMFTGCSSCQSENKPQENVVDNKDSSGVLPEPAPIVVENCISADRQAMFLKCNKDTSVYRWFESSIVLKDYLNADPDGEVESLTNIFQKIKEFDHSADVMVYFFKHTDKGVEVDSVHSFWMEDYPLDDEPVKITFKQAFNRLMEANIDKPESRMCVLRKQIGPKDCNPQYIFGNSRSQVYVDATNCNVQKENPAFGGDFGRPLGEWP